MIPFFVIVSIIGIVLLILAALILVVAPDPMKVIKVIIILSLIGIVIMNAGFGTVLLLTPGG